MKFALLALILLGAASVYGDGGIRQIRYDPAAKFYVLDSRVADDVRVCIAIAEDQTLACQSAKELRATYREGKIRK